MQTIPSTQKPNKHNRWVIFHRGPQRGIAHVQIERIARSTGLCEAPWTNTMELIASINIVEQ